MNNNIFNKIDDNLIDDNLKDNNLIYDNITDDNNQQNFEYTGITIILLLSFCQFSFYSLKNCYKTIKKCYNLNKKTKRIKNKDLENFIIECSICLEQYKLNEKIIQLDCDHIFHKECLNLWLKKNNSCPICRDNIII